MSDPLAEVATRTVSHYEANAEAFWEGTRDHDVSQNRNALLSALPNRVPLRILDFGCGPGRDLKAFRELGHLALGLDACRPFVEMARAFSGCEVLHQSFFQLDIPSEAFDGIFANASLFHAPRAVLPNLLQTLRAALVPAGVLFCSNPRSFDSESEGWQGERFGCHLTVEGWAAQLVDAGFTLERHYLRPSGKPPSEQPWVAMVARKATS